MSATTELPTWAAFAVAFGTPGSAFVGVLVGNVLTRRGAKELDRRAGREEVMRNLRWASELAVSVDDRTARLGVAELNALAVSDLLDDAAQGFIDAALDSVVKEPVEELEHAGEDAEIVEVVEENPNAARLDPSGVLSSAQQSDEA